MPIPDRGNVVEAGGSSQKSWQDLRRHPSVMESVTAFRNAGALLGCDDRSWAAPGYWGLWPSVAEPAKAKPLCYPLQHHRKKVMWSKARAFPTTVLLPLLPTVSFPADRQREATSDLWCALTSCFKLPSYHEEVSHSSPFQSQRHPVLCPLKHIT